MTEPRLDVWLAADRKVTRHAARTMIDAGKSELALWLSENQNEPPLSAAHVPGPPGEPRQLLQLLPVGAQDEVPPLLVEG